MMGCKKFPKHFGCVECTRWLFETDERDGNGRWRFGARPLMAGPGDRDEFDASSSGTIRRLVMHRWNLAHARWSAGIGAAPACHHVWNRQTRRLVDAGSDAAVERDSRVGEAVNCKHSGRLWRIAE